MRLVAWSRLVEPSLTKQTVIKAVGRARLLVFMRPHRHQLFERFQAELARSCVDGPTGSYRRRWRG